MFGDYAEFEQEFEEALESRRVRFFTPEDKRQLQAVIKSLKEEFDHIPELVREHEGPRGGITTNYHFNMSDIEGVRDMISGDTVTIDVATVTHIAHNCPTAAKELARNIKGKVKENSPKFKLSITVDKKSGNMSFTISGHPHGKKDKAWYQENKYAKKKHGSRTNTEIDSASSNSNDDADFGAFESASSQLRKDHKSFQLSKQEIKYLDSMYCVFMNDDALAKYENEHRQLAHVNKNAIDLRGHMYFWQRELACFVSIEKKGNKHWIDCIEVCKPFRGRGLSVQLLDVATKKFKATDLKVAKDNAKAIRIFEKYGFVKYDQKNNYIYMTIDANTKKKEIEYANTEGKYPKKKKNDAPAINPNLESGGYILAKEEIYGSMTSMWDDGNAVYVFPSIEEAIAHESVDLTNQEFFVLKTDARTNANHTPAQKYLAVDTIGKIRVLGATEGSGYSDLRWSYSFEEI